MVLKVNSGESPLRDGRFSRGSDFLGAARPVDGAGPTCTRTGRWQLLAPSHPINWKRHEADVFTRPMGT